MVILNERVYCRLTQRVSAFNGREVGHSFDKMAVSADETRRLTCEATGGPW